MRRGGFRSAPGSWCVALQIAWDIVSSLAIGEASKLAAQLIVLRVSCFLFL